jgi:acyl carrier protein
VDIEQRLLDIFESVLGPEARGISDQDGPGTIAAWDSVNHLNLILSIEAEFGIQFETSEIPDLLSLGKIRARLERG